MHYAYNNIIITTVFTTVNDIPKSPRSLTQKNDIMLKALLK